MLAAITERRAHRKAIVLRLTRYCALTPDQGAAVARIADYAPKTSKDGRK